MTEDLAVVKNVDVEFGVRSKLVSKLSSGSSVDGAVRALDGVSLTIRAEETVGIVGESGSGKSTLARVIVGLIQPGSGDVMLMGKSMKSPSRKALKAVRSQVQMVFQDPGSSLDPSMRVEDIVAEPLDIHLSLEKDERTERTLRALASVGLDASSLRKYPSEFSGGQKQRIGIARAIVLRPKLIVCDEVVSALDVSTQSQVLNLLKKLQTDLGLSFLFIGHDLAVIRWMSDRIAVMHNGQIVEHGDAQRLIDKPAHPYTEALVHAIPKLHTSESVTNSELKSADVVGLSQAAMERGCLYRNRCRYNFDICEDVDPDSHTVGTFGDDNWANCHLLSHGHPFGASSIVSDAEGIR